MTSEGAQSTKSSLEKAGLQYGQINKVFWFTANLILL